MGNVMCSTQVLVYDFFLFQMSEVLMCVLADWRQLTGHNFFILILRADFYNSKEQVELYLRCSNIAFI